jgi:hypothetical protein
MTTEERNTWEADIVACVEHEITICIDDVNRCKLKFECTCGKHNWMLEEKPVAALTPALLCANVSTIQTGQIEVYGAWVEVDDIEGPVVVPLTFDERKSYWNGMKELRSYYSTPQSDWTIYQRLKFKSMFEACKTTYGLHRMVPELRRRYDTVVQQLTRDGYTDSCGFNFSVIDWKKYPLMKGSAVISSNVSTTRTTMSNGVEITVSGNINGRHVYFGSLVHHKLHKRTREEHSAAA